MSTYKWLDQSHPQTLQIACWFLYLSAVFSLLRGGIDIVLVVGAVAAFFIANEKRWAYYLGVAIAGLDLLLTARLWLDTRFSFNVLISLIFAIALFVALLHPQSRSYQRIWFK
jgi:hypothetical protein